ncbi:ATP-binding protein [Actinomycetes bacterium KLBMP 9759]
MWRKLLDTLPRGYTLDEPDWQRRHRLLLWLLAIHLPALAVFAAALGHAPLTIASALVIPAACVRVGWQLRRHRRTASVTVTCGLVYCSTALVVFSRGVIEAHFHFFIIIGFIALYQDWAPFLFNILFTVTSHGFGSVWGDDLIFGTSPGQADPWLWSLIHGIAVLFACVGMMLFWRVTEDSQHEKDALSGRLADAQLSQRLAEAETDRQRFTSELLTNLARRNQSLLYRQLDIINQLENSEQDPDALAELFAIDHLATRVRRNAENLLVLSGEQPPRTWSEPVPLRDVLRAAIAETEYLRRVVFTVDERPAVLGHSVTDLTHLIAELTENAVRFSAPDTAVTIRARPAAPSIGGYVLTIEDWGVGMKPDELAAANALLADPPEVDLSVSQRLGFHVVARLAARHDVQVSLGATPGSGVTAVIILPGALFVGAGAIGAISVASGRGLSGDDTAPARVVDSELVRAALSSPPRLEPVPAAEERQWPGWWEPQRAAAGAAAEGFGPVPRAAKASDDTGCRLEPVLVPQQRSGGSSGDGDGPGGLRRRVPQTHLKPELRRPVHHDDVAPPVLPADVVPDAASALSRYQASRAAAQAEVDSGGHR